MVEGAAQAAQLCDFSYALALVKQVYNPPNIVAGGTFSVDRSPRYVEAQMAESRRASSCAVRGRV